MILNFSHNSYIFIANMTIFLQLQISRNSDFLRILNFLTIFSLNCAFLSLAIMTLSRNLDFFSRNSYICFAIVTFFLQLRFRIFLAILTLFLTVHNIFLPILTLF